MSIQLIDPQNHKVLSDLGDELMGPDGIAFPLINGAYRVAAANNYTDSFGFQWNKFQKTQIDRHNQSSLQSKERFFAVTHWDKEDLSGKNVLEVGSGAGRFTSVVLQHTKANIYSVDYSSAVEANAKNNGPDPRLKLFQASIYELPFAENQFDKVFCFGVLQHTPDFKRSVERLISMVKPGGELVVDFYPVRGWYTKIHAKYLLRPFTRRMNSEKLLSWIESNADKLISLYLFFDKIGTGKFVNRFLPVCDIKRTIPHDLKGNTLREWVILDTFDMFSPQYDHPQKLSTVVNWFKAFGMNEVKGSVVKYGDGNEVTTVKGIK
jgi:ubiquinone/menaquinone biosynthesis C-methylase UbiE